MAKRQGKKEIAVHEEEEKHIEQMKMEGKKEIAVHEEEKKHIEQMKIGSRG